VPSVEGVDEADGDVVDDQVVNDEVVNDDEEAVVLLTGIVLFAPNTISVVIKTDVTWVRV
jgi:hypothetical protein